jgi:hypothetical protein
MQILELGSIGNDVKTWQNYLISQGYTTVEPDGNFGQITENATKDFQKKHGLVDDGEVGPITWNFTLSLNHSAPNLIKSNKDVLQWVKNNLKTVIIIATTGTDFTEDWLASIAARETGGLITKYVNRGMSLNAIASLMEGDFTSGHYHGFSFWQIDVRSFPDFVNSGDWVNPQKSAVKATQVLEGKKQSLIHLHIQDLSLSPGVFDRAITASYNCGEGNVINSLHQNEDVDTHTANGNYSAQVFEFRKIYLTL